MALEDLDLILSKEAIVATYPAAFLRQSPADVEQVYSTHARTFIPLGDTTKHVDTLHKWVSGGNKGAFIGAVIGDYGHGKTSFQIHVWSECIKREVFAVPPFEWTKVSDWVEGTAAWVYFILSKTHPLLCRKAEKLYGEFKEKTRYDVAAEHAKQTGRDVDAVLLDMQNYERYGAVVEVEVTVERFLEYLAKATEIVQEAGYKGLLVSLDEPEVAAKKLGSAPVAQHLFDLANGLLNRQGNYGVFLSMPENFYASIQRTFSSLSSRLQERGCTPRLRDIYGSDFPATLWDRFTKEFQLGAVGESVVSRLALASMGQVAESERSDLSYGPRTVISAFRQMVRHYQDLGFAYEPVDFVMDCLNDEILVTLDYTSKIRSAVKAGKAQGLSEELIHTLAAFPNGVVVGDFTALGIEQPAMDSGRRAGVIVKRGSLYSLASLQQEAAHNQRDDLREALEEALSEFAPTPATFAAARDCFTDSLLPKIFERRSGQQFLGWDYPKRWKDVAGGVRLGDYEGAFRETEKEFPKRRILVAVGPLTQELSGRSLFKDPLTLPDVVVHFKLRWNAAERLPDRLLSTHVGDPLAGNPAWVEVVIDLTGDPLTTWPGVVEEISDRELFTPLAALSLVAALDKKTWTREYTAVWESMKTAVLRDLFEAFFVVSPLATQAARETGATGIGGGNALFGSLVAWIFSKRCPDYSTLMRQPLWADKVDDYVRALKNTDIPLPVKRANQTWRVSSANLAQALGISRMNLKDSYTLYGNLIQIKAPDKGEEYEVTFFLHPLERRIRDLLMAAQPPRRLKLDDGRETGWWMPADELIPVFFRSGYHLDEIDKIVKIGQGRETFGGIKTRDGFVLYCLPIDIEQMKIHLRDKLSALQTEVEGLKLLPNFSSSFDFAATAIAVESLTTESENDALASQINKEFEQCHNRFPGYYDRLAEKLRALLDDVRRDNQKVEGSRQVANLRVPATGTSRWCADLGRYIVSNLTGMIGELRKESVEIIRAAEQAHMECKYERAAKPLETIASLQKGWASLRVLEDRLKTFVSDAGSIMRKLDEYEQWRMLLRTSDEVDQELLDLAKEPANKVKAAELYAQLEALWTDISDHLQTRNVQGLGSHKQFAERFSAISTERKSYLNVLGVAFNQKKENLNSILLDMDLSADARCREAFNPLDSEGCYQRLFAEAVENIRRAVATERSDLSAQKLEVLYTHDVLGRLDATVSGPLLDRIATAQLDLDMLYDQLSQVPTTVENVASDSVPDLLSKVGIIPDAVKKALVVARTITREARLALRSAASAPKDDELSATATLMSSMLPANEAVNLKELILAFIQKGQDPSNVMEEALRSLGELFRQGRVQVKLELPRR